MKKLAAFGLVSLVALSFAGQAQAADTEAEVSFNTNWTIQPPIKTDSITNPGNGSGDENLAVIYAMNFQFGTHDYNGTALTDLPAQVGSYTTEAVIGSGTEAAPEFPSTTIQDALGISVGNSGNTNTWFLYANPTQFDNNGKTITGLTMTLNGVAARQVVGSTAATVADTTIELTPEADTLIANYDQSALSEKEMSITNIAFGTYTGSNAADMYDGVTLDVPAGRNINNGETYTSDITWTLAVDAL